MSYTLSRLEYDLMHKTEYDQAGYFIEKIFDYTLQNHREVDYDENDEETYTYSEMDESEIREQLDEGFTVDEFGIEHYENHKEDIERAYACRKNDGSINASLPISNDYKAKIHYVILQVLIKLGHIEA